MADGRKRHNRRGSFLFFVLFVFLIVATLGLRFHSWMRHTQAVSYRFEKKQVAQRLAEAALGEAFWRFHQATGQPDSLETSWLRRVPTQPLDLTVPVVQAQTAKLLGPFQQATFNVQARLVDHRASDSKGNRFGPGEFMGTIEIAARVHLADQRGNPIAATIALRHHDVKVMCLIPGRGSNRPNAYVQGALLDYLLFVKDGMAEFRDRKGFSLNLPQTKVDLIPTTGATSQAGRIFFGGTNPQVPSTARSGEIPVENAVFLNTAPQTAALLPPQPEREIYRIGLQDCITLFPELSRTKTGLGGLEGVFFAGNVPLTRAGGGNYPKLEEYTRGGLLGAYGETERNLHPGLLLLPPANLGDAGFAAEVLQGGIRQRFMSYVRFDFDLRNVQHAAKIRAQLNKGSMPPCIPIPLSGLGGFPPRIADFVRGLDSLGRPELVSRFVSEFPYQGGHAAAPIPAQASFPQPKLFGYTGNAIADPNQRGLTGNYPYFHTGFWGRIYDRFHDLETAGILDSRTNTLNLRGITFVNENVVIGGSTPLTIRGRGILMARGFRLAGGLHKAGPDDLCVLYSYLGPILIETSDRLDAVLISLHIGEGEGRILPTVPLNLHGGLLVDRLGTPEWSRIGRHTLAYDSFLARPEPVFCVHLSPLLTFRRMGEPG